MKNWIAILIAFSVMVIVYAIVIHHSDGRISQIEFCKAKLTMVGIYVVYAMCSFFVFGFFQTPVLFVVGLLLMPVFMFKWMQLSVQRLHDLNLSGWHLLLEAVPIVNLYFMVLRWFEQPSEGMNEYDISVSYVDFLKETRLYPKINCLELQGGNFKVNAVQFTHRRHEGREMYECSKMELEDDKTVSQFCSEQLETIENAPGYASEYRVSFLYREQLFESIRTNLHAIVLRNGGLVIDGHEVFVRKDGFSYDLVYDKNVFMARFDAFTRQSVVGNYCCVRVSKRQLKELVSSIA